MIAAEVATQRYVHRRLNEEGVSKNKLDNAKGDLKYSLMLNTVLNAVTPTARKPNNDLVGKMNRARNMRNDYMHNGIQPNDATEIAELYTRTVEYVKYIKSLENRVQLLRLPLLPRNRTNLPPVHQRRIGA